MRVNCDEVEWLLKLSNNDLPVKSDQPFEGCIAIPDRYDEERAQYPIEFMNSLQLSRIPPHRLSLKVGAVVMLLQNLNLHEGLCNGTCPLISHLYENCTDAAILTGTVVNSRVLIPRIQLAPSECDMPFVLTRCTVFILFYEYQ
ncbi:uncharacterized protein [Dysidea avara]|uniref:uncharacterized protein n=1 Tax=Dysidea avara TaxID=196820 RepID=UPI00331DA111